MADKKEIELEFTADTSKVKKAMREAKQFTGEMQTSSQKMNKATLKGTKDIAKTSKKISKLTEKSRGRKAIQDEKKLQREKKQTTTEVLKQAKAYASIQKEASNLQRTISGITSKTRDLNRELKKSTGMFGGGGRGGGGAAGGGRGGRPGGVSGFLGSFLKKGAAGLGKLAMGGALGLGGTLMGILTSQLTGGYQEKLAYGKAYGGLAGTGGKLSELQRLRGTEEQILQMHKHGDLEKLGFGPIEAAQQAAPIARATGVMGGRALKTGLATQRATTMGAGEVAQFMGLLTQAGSGFGRGGGGKKQLEKVIAAGMETGLERARLPEFFSGVSALTQRMAAATAGKVDVEGITRSLAMMGSTGAPGLKGARGAAVAQTIDRAIRQPGGGEAGEAFMLQAYGFGKPGGDATYYEAMQRREKGLSDPENLRDVVAEAQRRYGGKEERALAMKKLLKIDTLIWEELEKAVDTGDKEKIDKVLKKTQSVDKQALAEMQEFGDTTRHMADLQNRSVGIGESIEDSVKRLEEVINEFVINALPLAVKALDKIATVVEDIYLWLVGSDVEGKKAKQTFDTSVKKYKELRKQRRAGEIGPEEYSREIKKLQLKMNFLEEDIFRTPGWIEKGVEGAEHLYTSTGRMLGIETGKSDIARRGEVAAKARKRSTKFGAEFARTLGLSKEEVELLKEKGKEDPLTRQRLNEAIAREQAQAHRGEGVEAFTLDPETKALFKEVSEGVINFTEEAARPKRQGNPANNPTATPTKKGDGR